jgi:hypothetical protein
MKTARTNKSNQYYQVFGIFLIFAMPFMGNFMSIYLVYAIFVVAFLLALRRFIENKKQGINNKNFYFLLIFIMLSILMNFII